MRNLWTTCVLVCMACGPLDHVYKAEPNLLEPARAAAWSWCVASDSRYCPQVTSDIGLPLVWGKLPPGRCAGYYGHGYHEGIRIGVDRAGCGYVQALIAHELGHAGGIDSHLPGCEDVMSDCPDRPAEPTEADVAALDSTDAPVQNKLDAGPEKTTD